MLAARARHTPLAAILVGALALSALVGPAHGRERRDEAVGTAVAVGIGALVIGSIIAGRSRHRHSEAASEPPRNQRFDQNRYHHPAPHVNRAPSNSGR